MSTERPKSAMRGGIGSPHASFGDLLPAIINLIAFRQINRLLGETGPKFFR